MGHKGQSGLLRDLEEAKQRVKVGGVYAHYKNQSKTYEVLHLGFIEANDQVCVIYQGTYNPGIVFVRPLESWLETPEWEGVKVPRFKLIN